MIDAILWDNATRDYDAEQRTAQLERARVALADTVPFIVKAASHDEYLDRIALMQDKIEATLRGLATSEAEYVGLFGSVMSSLDEDFNTLRQARRVKAEAEMDAEEPEDDSDAPEASEDAEEASDEDESDDEDEDEPKAADKEARRKRASRSRRPNRKVALNEFDLLEVESDGALVFGRANANRFYRALLAAGIEASEPEFSDMAVGNHFNDDGDEYLTEEETYWIGLPAEQVGYEALESIFKNAKRKRAALNMAESTDDWFVCECGNSARDEGFYTVLPDGTEVEPLEGSDWEGHWRCDRCGYIVTPEEESMLLEAKRKRASRKRAVRKTAMRVDDVLPHAIEALWFIGMGPDGEPLDSRSDYGSVDMDPSDERKVRDSLEAFLREAGDLIDESGLGADDVGHSFVFSATGQGTGFWDRGLGAIGDELHSITERTSQFREGLYGEDGQVYVSSRKKAALAWTTYEDAHYATLHGLVLWVDGWDGYSFEWGVYPRTVLGWDEEGIDFFDALKSGDIDSSEALELGGSDSLEGAKGDSFSAAHDLNRMGYPLPFLSSRKRGNRKRASDMAHGGAEPVQYVAVDEDGVRRLVSPNPIPAHSRPYHWTVWAEYADGSSERMAGPAPTASRRKRAVRKTARKPVKGIAIYPDKRVEEVTISSLSDYQSIVGGLIEPVTLSDGSTMYVNEEGLYLFGPDDFNSIATDVAGLGGATHLLMSGVLGPVVVVGPVSNDGYDTDVTSAARAWVNRVAREASVKRRGSRRHTAGPEMWEVRQHDSNADGLTYMLWDKSEATPRQHDFHTSPNAAGNTDMVWGRFDSEDEATTLANMLSDTFSPSSPFEVVRVGKNSKRRNAALRRTAAADFDSWMAKVNQHVESKVGLSADDLADQPYYDWFEDGITPAQAARLLLTNEGYTGSRRKAARPSKRRSPARRRTAYNDHRVNPTGDSNYNYDEYQRGQVDGWDDGYNAATKKNGPAVDRRHDWKMDPSNDYESGYQDAYGEGFRSGYEERTGYGSQVAPSWFDPEYAGERWDEDY